MGKPASISSEVFRDHLALLRERLWSLLEEVPPPLRADVILALQQHGKLLAAEGPAPAEAGTHAGRWPLLTLLVACCVQPQIDRQYAGEVALAVECLVSAIDIFDDVIDDDQTAIIRCLGVARAINVATALMALAQQALLAAVARAEPSAQVTAALLQTLQVATLRSLAGQQRDLLAEALPLTAYGREECIALAAAKAGSLMSLACRLGAVCAQADEVLCQRFAELGELLGIAAQLDNDCHDLYALIGGPPPEREGGEMSESKSDLVRGKKTLPLVLAAAAGCALSDLLELSDAGQEATLARAREAITTAWGISLLYRERARACLQAIEGWRPVPPELRLLLGVE